MAHVRNTDPYANKQYGDVPKINSREMYVPPKKKLEPKIDVLVSRIVGKKIYAQDPRLLKLVVKWKKNKPEDSLEPDNFLDDSKKRDELKKVLGGNL